MSSQQIPPESFIDSTADAPDSVEDRHATDDEVHDCFIAALEHFKSNLTSTTKALAQQRWGFDAETVETLGIGFVRDDNSLVENLRDEGYSPATMLRTGLVTDGVVKHLYECDVDDCRHDFPAEIETVAQQRDAGSLDPAQIRFEDVLEYADEEDLLWLRNWWESRLIIPYRDAEGTYRYTIARKTGQSDDTDGKYIKQTFRKPWVDSSTIFEPLYGCHTVAADEPLVITEGITDAIAAHQHGIRAVSPATTQVKEEQLSKILQYATTAGDVFIANDTEVSDEGLKGALRTGADLYVNGVDAHIVELPVPDDRDEIDLAEFLKERDRDAFAEAATSGTPVIDHPRLEELTDVTPEALEESRESTAEDSLATAEDSESSSEGPAAVAVTGGGDDCEGAVPTAVQDEEKVDRYGSLIYELELADVCGVEPGYRGDNPIEHVGESHSNYFSVFREVDSDGETTLRAFDHKTRHGYNALTWLACASGARPTDKPGGQLNARETWEVWKFAKQEGLVPESDPVPARGIWHLCAENELCEPSRIPSSHDDGKVPPGAYNEALSLIARTYGLDPGRDRLSN